MPLIKTTVIVNPDSKPRRINKYLEPVLSLLQSNNFKISTYFTCGPGDGYVFAEQALDNGAEVIIVAGGDGTVNEVLNAIVGNDVILGILPFGGSNVLAREMGMPLNPIKAAELILKKNVKNIDLGVINNRYFSMMASCGYDAYAVGRTSREIKKILHRYAYIWAGIKDFMGYRPTLIEVDLDDGTTKEYASFVVVSNTHFYGGSYQLTPFARIDDGLLDICLYQGRYQLGLVHFVFNMLSQKHLTMSNVKYYRAKSIQLTSKKHTLVQVDGDILGALPMKAQIVPTALKVFCSQSGSI